jgi:hypothetical protein
LIVAEELLLRAQDETTLAMALPMLRTDDGAAWLPSPAACGIDVIGPLVVEPAVIDPYDMSVVAEAVLDARFHVNLIRRAGADPDAWAAIVSAAAPYAITVSQRRRRFQ